MTQVRVFGHSDDLVEIKADTGKSQEFSVSDSNWQGRVTAPNGDTAILYVDYRDAGVWTVALGREDEDVPFPSDWHIGTITDDENANGYTVIGLLELPPGTTIVSQGSQGTFTV